MKSLKTSSLVKTIYLVILALCLTKASAQQNLMITPKVPNAGEVIKIYYSPGGNLLNRKETLEGIAYTFSDVSKKETDLVFVKTDGHYTATINTDTSDLFVQLAFFINKEFDNNNNDGYTFLLYKNGKPKKGSHICRTYFYYFDYEQSGVERNETKALAAMEEEFRLYPEQKKLNAGLYYRIFRDVKPNDLISNLEGNVEGAMKEGLTSEQDYNYLITLFDAGSLPQQSLFFKNLRKEKFPNGAWRRNEQIEQFINEADVAKKEAMLDTLIHNIETDKNWVGYKNEVNFLKSNLLFAYAENKMWDAYRKMVSTIPDKNRIAANHNGAAWILQEKNEDLAIADEFATFATDHSRAELKKPTGKKPDYLSEKQWERERANTYIMYADTWAMVKFRQGEYKKGFDVAKDVALIRKKGEDSELNKTYVLLAEKVLPSKELKPQLEKMVKEGKAPTEANDILRRIYVAEKKTDSGFDNYIGQLSLEVTGKKTDEIKKSLISEAAPAFELIDAQGKTVRLEDYKGKIIVLDFWATWCGPCISSFPGMQKAVDKYKENPNVKFLFVNTLGTRREQRKESSCLHCQKELFV
jgi:hypothetical protein